MHFEIAQRQQRRNHSHLCAATACVEEVTRQGHQRKCQGRGETRGKFRHRTCDARHSGNHPVQQRWFEGNLVSVVDWQHPVIILQHRVCHDSLTGFAARVKKCVAQKQEQRQQAYYTQYVGHDALLFFRIVSVKQAVTFCQ